MGDYEKYILGSCVHKKQYDLVEMPKIKQLVYIDNVPETEE